VGHEIGTAARDSVKSLRATESGAMRRHPLAGTADIDASDALVK